MRRALGLVSYVLALAPLAFCAWMISYGAAWGFSARAAWPSFAVMIGFAVWFVAVGRKLRSTAKVEKPVSGQGT